MPTASLAGGKPSFDVDSQGFVVGERTVDAPADHVSAVVVEFERMSSTSHVFDVHVKPDGKGEAVTRGLFSPLRSPPEARVLAALHDDALADDSPRYIRLR